MSQEVS